MPITARKDGTVFYRIDGVSPSVMLASNRQKKVLRLFDVHFGPSISAGAAGWVIAEMPGVAIAGNVFIFTDKFGFGSRDACRKAVTMRGGRAPDQNVSREV